MQTFGVVTFDLLFDGSRITSDDFAPNSALVDALRASIAEALHVTISFVNVTVVTQTRLLAGVPLLGSGGGNATSALQPVRRLGAGVALATTSVRVRVSIVTSLSTDAATVRSANEHMEALLAASTVEELLALFTGA
ncbi:hypothetical protein EON66_03255 [archaeon]|nr:MAG: hypothetical protein EON66_03255 [archaeon]